MQVEEVAEELYGLPPEEFTAARNALAKGARADGHRDLAAAITALRRPTAGAHVLNVLARTDPGTVEQVVDLGVRLRAAQGTSGQKELRALDDERRALTRAVARQAVDAAGAAGRRVSAAVAGAVEETLRSAMVDADAGAALLTGLLVDTFSSTGLEPVDLSRVVAVGRPALGRSAAARTPSVPPTSRGPDEAELAAARAGVEDAEREARRARAEADEARGRAAEAGRRREDLESELAEVRRRLAALEERLGDATEATHEARRAQLATTRREQAALETLERARRRLDELPGG